MPLFGTTEDSWWWLCTDSCGLTCATITWMLHFYAWATITQLVVKPWFGSSFWGWFHYFAFSILTFLSLFSHGRAMLTNPGAVPCNAFPLQYDWEDLQAEGGWREKRTCLRCKSFKPPRAHHDSVTGRCILRLDHYCPWVNNAVGLLNHKYFLLFVLYTFLQTAYSNSLLLSAFFFCSIADDPESESCKQFGALTFMVFLEAILFGLFTLCMICDQSPMLLKYETKIDRLKGVKHGAATSVNEVFGIHSNFFGRLSPFHPVSFPRDALDDVLGFVLVDKRQVFNQNRPKAGSLADPEDIECQRVKEEEDDVIEINAFPSEVEEVDFSMEMAFDTQDKPIHRRGH